MEHKVLLGLLLLFLGFSYVLTSRPLPPSDNYLKSSNEDLSIQEFVEQGDLMELEEAIIRGRIDIESNDYPEPKPNPRHNPKIPPPYETKISAGRN